VERGVDTLCGCVWLVLSFVVEVVPANRVEGSASPFESLKTLSLLMFSGKYP
jgi:hypothetical protein